MEVIMRKRTFVLYCDPGHAWLKVDRKTLADLAIWSQISSYSYIRGEFLYLEGDCDAGVFLKALKENNIPYQIKSQHTNKTSKIRGYQRFPGYHSSFI
jgi:hypothetical protein